MIDRADAITSLRPNAQWRMIADVVYWDDTEQTQPTEDEIQAEVARLTADLPRKKAENNRARAFSEEADPLFFKAQRGEATIAEWETKVAEIRARYPYPA